MSNRDPVLTQTAIVPSPSYNDSTLTCKLCSSDLDGQTVSLTYIWQDAAGSTVGSTDTLDLTTLSGVQPADVFTCIVTGNDGVVTVNDTKHHIGQSFAKCGCGCNYSKSSIYFRCIDVYGIFCR